MWLFYFILYASNARRAVTIKMAHSILSHSLFFGGGGITTTTTTIISTTTTTTNNNIQIQCLNIL